MNLKKFLNERCVRGGRAHQPNKAINQNVFYVISAKYRGFFHRCTSSLVLRNKAIKLFCCTQYLVLTSKVLWWSQLAILQWSCHWLRLHQFMQSLHFSAYSKQSINNRKWKNAHWQCYFRLWWGRVFAQKQLYRLEHLRYIQEKSNLFLQKV